LYPFHSDPASRPGFERHGSTRDAALAGPTGLHVRLCQDADDVAFAVGQYVELYPTIPSSDGASSVDSGTRGIVDRIDLDRGEDIYFVTFLWNEQRTSEAAWLREIDLFPA
jgi:hypothetical protein